MIHDTFIEATLTPQIKHFTISTLPLDIYIYLPIFKFYTKFYYKHSKFDISI